jgi:hypothetical protein
MTRGISNKATIFRGQFGKLHFVVYTSRKDTPFDVIPTIGTISRVIPNPMVPSTWGARIAVTGTDAKASKPISLALIVAGA